MLAWSGRDGRRLPPGQNPFSLRALQACSHAGVWCFHLHPNLCSIDQSRRMHNKVSLRDHCMGISVTALYLRVSGHRTSQTLHVTNVRDHWSGFWCPCRSMLSRYLIQAFFGESWSPQVSVRDNVQNTSHTCLEPPSHPRPSPHPSPPETSTDGDHPLMTAVDWQVRRFELKVQPLGLHIETALVSEAENTENHRFRGR